MSYEAELEQWRRERRWALRTLGAIVGAALLVLALASTVQSCRRGVVNSQLKRNLHEIQLAVERYAVDTEGRYPMRIEQVVQRGYLPHMPLNPLTEAPMRHVTPPVATQLPQAWQIAQHRSVRHSGWDSSGVDSLEAIRPGDFVYLPEDARYDNPNYAEGYVLMLYELE